LDRQSPAINKKGYHHLDNDRLNSSFENSASYQNVNQGVKQLKFNFTQDGIEQNKDDTKNLGFDQS